MSVALNSAAAGWLAQDPPDPPQGPEFGGSSPIGLVVILLLAVALTFLIKSMNKHLRKVPRSFDSTDQPQADKKHADQERSAGAEGAASGDSGTASATNGAGATNGEQGRSGDPN
jgi:hypothetical protein